MESSRYENDDVDFRQHEMGQKLLRAKGKLRQKVTKSFELQCRSSILYCQGNKLIVQRQLVKLHSGLLGDVP